MKKRISILLSVITAVSVMLCSPAVYADDENGFNVNVFNIGTYTGINSHTCMYYDKNTKDIYMSAYDYVVTSGDSDLYKTWLYHVNDKNVCEQQCKISQHTRHQYNSVASTQKVFYKDLKICSADDYQQAFYMYEKNDNMVKINVDSGMSTYRPTTHYSDLPDYSDINKVSLDLENENTAVLDSKVLLDGNYGLNLIWKSSDPSVASSDKNGNITTHSSGECYITCEIEGAGQSAEYHITVSETKLQGDANRILANMEDSSMKDKYNAVYNNLGNVYMEGHVITDIDGDGEWEMAVRTSDKKTISIYKIIDNKLAKVRYLTGITRADLIYSSLENPSRCYLRTIKKDGDEFVFKIFKYNGAYKDMDQLYECSVDFDTRKTEVEKGLPYMTCVWRESFNDDFYDALPGSDSEYKLTYVHDDMYKFSDYSITGHFFYNYYKDNEDDVFTMMYGFDSWFGYGSADNPGGIQNVMVNELFARHGYKFKSPMLTAFMNKKHDYKADPNISADYILNHFNKYEKYHFDHLEYVYVEQV